eukprot:scaffold425_cov365-Pavlova_lutheri.AAC.8
MTPFLDGGCASDLRASGERAYAHRIGKVRVGRVRCRGAEKDHRLMLVRAISVRDSMGAGGGGNTSGVLVQIT